MFTVQLAVAADGASRRGHDHGRIDEVGVVCVIIVIADGNHTDFSLVGLAVTRPIATATKKDAVAPRRELLCERVDQILELVLFKFAELCNMTAHCCNAWELVFSFWSADNQNKKLVEKQNERRPPNLWIGIEDVLYDYCGYRHKFSVYQQLITFLPLIYVLCKL